MISDGDSNHRPPIVVIKNREMTVKRKTKYIALITSGAMLMQFGGCVADILGDVFFWVGPFLL